MARSEWQKIVDDMFWGGEEFEARQRRVADQQREGWFQAVLINPSVDVLGNLCRQSTYGDLRGVLHEGDLYWWDSFYATHNDAMRWMKIVGCKIDKGVELHTCDGGVLGLTAFEQETLDAALTHPTLSGRIDGEFNLILET